MHTVQQILKRKEIDKIFAVAPDDTVFEAIQLMAEKHIGAVLVMEDDELKGILSERDYAREVILKGRASRETLVGQIMSSEVITVSPTQGVHDALTLMSNNRIRHLPVVVDGAVVGMVSIGDLVKDVIDAQQQTIQELENYIRG
ncbi:MAG: CBS domain-containing protein [Pseudohongiellaceae bacterium]